MAATIAQSTFGLQAPANDDTMEISSDFGNMDGDIDIDLDSAGEQMQYEDDDQMIDDVKSDTADHHHDDDVMVDGDTASVSGDRDMQDDAPAPSTHEHDEELLDFSDDEDIYANDAVPAQPVVQVVEPTAAQSEPVATEAAAQKPVQQVPSEAAAELHTEGVHVIDYTSQHHQVDHEPQPATESHHGDPSTAQAEEQPSGNSEENEAEASTQAPAEAVVEGHDSTGTVTEKEVVPSSNHPAVTESVETTVEPLDQSSKAFTEAHSTDSTHGQSTETRVDALDETDRSDQAEKPTLHLVDTEAAGVDEADDTAARERQPNSPTVTGLHPTVVEYDSNEIYLFPSSDPTASEQYLLANENLVTSSLGDLLQACRSVLGESLSEDEELVLGVEELDLYVSEDSTPAFSISFVELLDVFLQLHKHDGNNNPPPFRVTLTTKTRFTNRMNLLTQAIAEGKGFSQLEFLQHYDFDEATGFPEEEDFDDESYHEAGGDHDHLEQQQHIETEHQHNEDTNPEPAPQEDATEEHHEQGLTEHNDEHDNTDNYVSEYATEEHEEPIRNEDQSQEPARDQEGQDGQEETQYYDAEGDESYEGVHDEDQHDGPAAPVAQDQAAEIDGEDELADFYRDEDDDRLTTNTASAEGNEDATQADALSGLPVDENKAAQAVEDTDEIPAPPEDEHFDDDFLEDDSALHEEIAPEETQSAFADTEADNGAENGNIPSADANVAEGADVGEQTADVSAHKVQEADETVLSQELEDQRQAEYENGLDESFDAGFNTSGQDETASAADDQHDELDDHDDDGGEATANSSINTAQDTNAEIDFDEDDDFNDQQISTQKLASDAESTKSSPSIKRSFSERNEAEDVDEDEHALKKVRSS